MKTKFIAIAALAATTLLASCNKENEGGKPSGEEKNVFLKMEQPGTRAAADKVTDYTVEFASGAIYFTDAAGNITKYLTITTAATSATNLNLTDLTGVNGISGIVVPGATSKVYVVGNYPASATALPTAGNYSAVEAMVMTAADQKGSIVANAIKGVTLYSGAAVALTESVPGADDWSATVTPQQIANRVELVDITASATSHITGFTVEGVYVNNFYEDKTLGAAALPADLINYQDVVANYAAGQGLYTVADAGIFYDESAAAAVANVAVPAAGKVWAYNLLAGAEVPRLIIKLSNITVENGYSAPAGGTGFLTVKLSTDGTEANLVNFSVGGKVFTIAAGALEFSLTDITPKPETKSITAKVKIGLVNWVPVPIVPAL